MRLLAIFAMLLFGAVAFAQQSYPTEPLDRLLTGITINSRAIENGDLPPDEVQKLANEIWNYASQVPFLVGDNPDTQGILVELRTSAGRLMDRATAQDLPEAARNARDLLDESDRLRRVFGLTP